MEPHVFLAVLAAAAMHATWNALLKLKLEPFLTMTLMTGMAGLAGMPAMAIFGAPILPAWPWLIASVIRICSPQASRPRPGTVECRRRHRRRRG